jgi:hypothetical protein
VRAKQKKGREEKADPHKGVAKEKPKLYTS